VVDCCAGKRFKRLTGRGTQDIELGRGTHEIQLGRGTQEIELGRGTHEIEFSHITHELGRGTHEIEFRHGTHKIEFKHGTHEIELWLRNKTHKLCNPCLTERPQQPSERLSPKVTTPNMMENS